MEPITGLIMLVSSIGMQFATNNANNKQSEELADLQRRYQDLLDRQKIEHSRQLQIEMNNLQVAMENKVHLLRMKEIEDSHDEIIEGLVHGHDIDSWPLNVLPFVIKGKSFGSKIGGGAKTISVHCFLTPSNSAAFNRVLYSELDIKLQSDINTNWSTRSAHPIFYYGGAWRDKSADINHIFNCIDQLATELRSMPCIVITPFFEKDGVSFRINMWGMGDGEKHFASFTFKNADICTSQEDIKFSYNYSIDQKFDKSDFDKLGDGAVNELDDFLDTTRDEFSTYLQTLIGFITDKYFWSMYGASPVLPSLFSQGKLCTDGMHWLAKGLKLQYTSLIKESLSAKKYDYSLPDFEKQSALIAASKPILDINVLSEFEDELLHNKAIYQSRLQSENNEKYFKQTQRVVSLIDILEKGKASSLPQYDQFHIVNVKEKNYVVIYFTKNQDVVFDSANKLPLIICYDKFDNPFQSLWEDDELVLELSQIEQLLNKTKIVMNGKNLLDSIDSVMGQAKKEVKTSIRKSQSSDESITEISKTSLSYDDVMSWVKQNFQPKYNGIILCRKVASFFDKGDYKLYICFAIDKEAQGGASDPSVVFVYEKLDEALTDMLQDKDVVTINLQKK